MAGAGLALILSLLLSGATHWMSARSSSAAILEGAFTSCADNDDGTYGERVFTWTGGGKIPIAEIHLGPRDEFAIFRGEVPDEREHSSRENLLGPAFHYEDVKTAEGGRNWSISHPDIHLNVIRVEGSYTECYTYFVKADGRHPTFAAR